MKVRTLASLACAPALAATLACATIPRGARRVRRSAATS